MSLIFQGTIPGPLRSIIREAAEKWPKGADVWIGCSGNFTIERSLADMGFRLHSNDVSIYTSALGWYFTGQDIPITLKPEHEDLLGWITPYLDGGPGTIATLMLGTRFLADVEKPGVYYQRNYRAYREQFPRMHAETVDRMKNVTLRLDSYHPKDVREYLRDDVPEDGIVTSFPPFYAAGYEKLYEPFERYFDWPAPEYPILDEDGITETLDLICDRPTWIMATNVEQEDRRANLNGYVEPALKAAPFWVYTSESPTRVVTARQKAEPCFLPRMGPEHEITEDSTISIVPLKVGEFESLRLLYLNRNITAMNTDVVPYAVMVDGRMAGVFAFGSWVKPDVYTLMTDFALPRTRYKRLSKLIIAAAVSVEATRRMERSWTRRAHGVQTAVFTNRPMSMKYRGLWDLRERVDLPKTEKFKYKITYESGVNRWTLNEALQMWLKKWGETA